MFEYLETGEYFAQTAGSMEDYAARELKEFGAKNIKTAYRGVFFTADKEKLYRIVYQAKLLSHILAPLMKFTCHDTKYLYKRALEIEWDTILTTNQTFAISAKVANSNITHSKYAALKLKDAIADYFYEAQNKRPDVDKINPDLLFHLYIHNNFATIYVDVAGFSLHKRGYRLESVEAPMQETLAAAIIKLSGWNGKTKLIDPMCGSGTLLSEALMSYSRIPTGFKKENYSFQYLPDFDKDIWGKIRNKSKTLVRELPKDLIFGNDILRSAVRATATNLDSIPFGRNVTLSNKHFEELPKLENYTIITNPPYGIRLENKEKVKVLYKNLGDFLKNKCQNSTAYIYFGDRSLMKYIGLKPSRKIPLVSGQLDGRLAVFEIY